MPTRKSESMTKGSRDAREAALPISAVSAERTKISRGYRGPGRLLSSTRVESLQGWRSSFLSF